MDKIYLITTVEKLEDKNDNGFLSVGSSRSVGWYETFEKAEYTVINNICDLWETCYNYAIIEEIEQGLYPCIDFPSSRRWIYKYNIETNNYEKIIDFPPIYSTYILPIGEIG